MTRTEAQRMVSNGNITGSSANRRVRRRWLLKTFGDGTTAPCSFGCGTMLVDDKTAPNHIWVDRYPIPGKDGGTYKRGNIRPACGPCSCAEGGYFGSAAVRAKKGL